MKFDNTLLETLRIEIKSGEVPLLLGEPGIGKSSFLENLAKLMRTECFILPANQLADKGDVNGVRLMPYTKDDGTEGWAQKFFPHHAIVEANDYALAHPKETPILFIDEVNRTSADVNSELLSLATMRSMGSTKLAKNLAIVMAGNDKGNVLAMDEASTSRFVLHHVEPDVGTFLGLDANLHPWIRATLEDHPETLFGKTYRFASTDDENAVDAETVSDIEAILGADEMLEQITTPRTVMGLSRFLNNCDPDWLRLQMQAQVTRDGEQISVLQELFEGHVGRTLFTTYLVDTAFKDLSSANPSTSMTKVIRPDAMDQLESASSKRELEDIAEAMTASERSGCFLYSLYEGSVAREIIEVLATFDDISDEDTSTLVKLATANALDDENLGYFLSTGTPLASRLAILATLN